MYMYMCRYVCMYEGVSTCKRTYCVTSVGTEGLAPRLLSDYLPPTVSRGPTVRLPSPDGLKRTCDIIATP